MLGFGPVPPMTRGVQVLPPAFRKLTIRSAVGVGKTVTAGRVAGAAWSSVDGTFAAVRPPSVVAPARVYALPSVVVCVPSALAAARCPLSAAGWAAAVRALSTLSAAVRVLSVVVAVWVLSVVLAGLCVLAVSVS
ncbi:hypothetical protein, partial [Micromonospora sp. NPDC093277]|uniref:hypothetical protein n=1 Tax=Micromonospora sp. NPDC093277 TaxID=3364291 RepID=UPI00380E8AD9